MQLLAKFKKNSVHGVQSHLKFPKIDQSKSTSWKVLETVLSLLNWVYNILSFYLLRWSEWTMAFAGILNTVLLAGIFSGIWYSLSRFLPVYYFTWRIRRRTMKPRTVSCMQKATSGLVGLTSIVLSTMAFVRQVPLPSKIDFLLYTVPIADLFPLLSY